jgi:hypothetical protein
MKNVAVVLIFRFRALEENNSFGLRRIRVRPQGTTAGVVYQDMCRWM